MNRSAIALLLLGLCAPLPASTIFNQTSSSQGVLSSTSAAFGFNLASTWNNVVITWEVASNNPPATVAAYLTTQIGLGTDASHNVVPSAIVNAPGAINILTLFSGLTLGPGNYYVSIQTSNALTGPLGGGTATDTLGLGVTSLGTFTLTGGAPAGTPVAAVSGMRFNVSGDPAEAVPEPSTWVLNSLGFVVIGTIYRKRRRNA